MTAPAVFWPVLLGLGFLAAGLTTYWRGPHTTSGEGLGRGALGPVFVAASLAAFAGEHFTAARALANLVPRWLPAPLFIAYFVGVAHLAAASSFVARRVVRWAAFLLALMFALFVLLMDLPAAMAHPAVRIDWSLAAREATFAIGALALFTIKTQRRWPGFARTLSTIARMWTAGVLLFYGIENVLYPRFSPGVPDVVPTPSWVPVPSVIAYVTGIVLVACGIAMFAERYAGTAAAACGALMVLLTVALYVPQFFIARDVPGHVLALNFVFDTLLFGGMMLVIGTAVGDPRVPVLEAAPETVAVAIP